MEPVGGGQPAVGHKWRCGWAEDLASGAGMTKMVIRRHGRLGRLCSRLLHACRKYLRLRGGGAAANLGLLENLGGQGHEKLSRATQVRFSPVMHVSPVTEHCACAHTDFCGGSSACVRRPLATPQSFRVKSQERYPGVPLSRVCDPRAAESAFIHRDVDGFLPSFMPRPGAGERGGRVALLWRSGDGRMRQAREPNACWSRTCLFHHSSFSRGGGRGNSRTGEME